MATFTVTRRAERGAKPKQLRKKGFIPMSIVDRAHTTHLIQASITDLKQAFGSTDSRGMMDVQIEGDSGVLKAIIKSVDSDPIAHQILSVTLQEVAADDTINATVPVIATGHSDDADGEGVVLTAVTTELKVRAKVSNLPEAIEVDVSKLHPGEHISASDVALPEGVELHQSGEAVLFTLSTIAEPDLEPETAPPAYPLEEGATEADQPQDGATDPDASNE